MARSGPRKDRAPSFIDQLLNSFGLFRSTEKDTLIDSSTELILSELSNIRGAQDEILVRISGIEEIQEDMIGAQDEILLRISGIEEIQEDMKGAQDDMKGAQDDMKGAQDEILLRIRRDTIFTIFFRIF